MPKIHITAPNDIIDNLKIISSQMNRTLSKAACEIIKLGLLSYKNKQKIQPQTFPKVTKFDLKNREYLLSILNINVEILRKLYNEPSKHKLTDTNSILSEIQTHIKNYIETEFK